MTQTTNQTPMQLVVEVKEWLSKEYPEKTVAVLHDPANWRWPDDEDPTDIIMH